MRFIDSIKFRIVLAAGLLFALLAFGTSLLLTKAWIENVDNRRPPDAARALDRMCALLVAGKDPSMATVASSAPVRFDILGPEGRTTGLLPTGAIDTTGVPLECQTPIQWVQTRNSDGSLATASRPVDYRTGYVLSVTVPLQATNEDIATVANAVRVGVPLLVVVVSGMLWIVTARALSPVRRIGRQSAQISLGTLDQRLPEPRHDDELAELTRHLNRMLDRLEQAAVRQRQFVSDASHELRSPVATILAVAESKMADPGMDRIHSEASRLAGLLDALLELARANEASVTAAEDVPVADVLMDDADRCEAAADAKSVSIDTIGVETVSARVSRPALIGIVRNLVDNAVRHSTHEVVLTSRRVDGQVEITVADDGPGVPAALHSSIFDRFVRGDDGRARDEGGAGLGLALVRDLATAYGGDVRVEDRVGGGARFVVTLPSSDS